MRLTAPARYPILTNAHRKIIERAGAAFNGSRKSVQFTIDVARHGMSYRKDCLS